MFLQLGACVSILQLFLISTKQCTERKRKLLKNFAVTAIALFCFCLNFLQSIKQNVHIRFLAKGKTIRRNEK